MIISTTEEFIAGVLPVWLLYLKRTRLMFSVAYVKTKGFTIYLITLLRLKANGLKKRGNSIAYIISSLRKEGNWPWCGLAAYEDEQKSNVFSL